VLKAIENISVSSIFYLIKIEKVSDDIVKNLNILNILKDSYIKNEDFQDYILNIVQNFMKNGI
jgi:hypothetical protein